MREYDVAKTNCIMVLFLVLAMAFFFINTPISFFAERQGSTISNDDWYYYEDGRKIEVTLPSEIHYDEKNFLTLYKDNLPSEVSSLMLYTKAARYTPKIFANDSLLYRYENYGLERNDSVLGNQICYAHLPKTMDNVVIRLELYNSDEDVYYVPKVSVESIENFLIDNCVENAYTLILAVIMLVTGFFALAITIFIKRYSRRVGQPVSIGLFLILCSLWCLSDSPVIQLLAGYSNLLSCVSFLLFMVFPIPMFYYVYYAGEIRKSISFKVYIALFSANVFIQCILAGMGKYTFFDMLIVTHILYLIGLLMMVVLLANEYRKNKEKEIKVALCAFAVLAALGGASIILYQVVDYAAYQRVFITGILMFVGILLFNVFAELVNNMKYRVEAAAYKLLSEEDKLTKLPNRRAFDLQMQELEKECENYKDMILIFMDLNKLKMVNDNVGHSAGDELIIAAADCIKKAYAGIGCCYRIGGDEFCAIILNNTEKLAIKQLLTDVVDEYNLLFKPENSLSIACGYSYFRNEDGTKKSFAQWKEEADKRMYEDKMQREQMSLRKNKRRT